MITITRISILKWRSRSRCLSSLMNPDQQVNKIRTIQSCNVPLSGPKTLVNKYICISPSPNESPRFILSWTSRIWHLFQCDILFPVYFQVHCLSLALAMLKHEKTRRLWINCKIYPFSVSVDRVNNWPVVEIRYPDRNAVGTWSCDVSHNIATIDNEYNVLWAKIFIGTSFGVSDVGTCCTHWRL